MLFYFSYGIHKLPFRGREPLSTNIGGKYTQMRVYSGIHRKYVHIIDIACNVGTVAYVT